MRQLVCIMAVAAVASLFCADSASARGRRGGSSRGCGSSCSSGYSGCSTGGCYSGGYAHAGCSTGGCYSGGYVISGCSTGSCGTAVYASSCGSCVASAPLASSTCVQCATLGMGEAKLVVNLPTSATLAIDNYETKSTSAQRVFQTPPLKTGREYSYTLTAKVERDGKPVTVSRKVTVRAGETTEITLEVPAKAVASR